MNEILGKARRAGRCIAPYRAFIGWSCTTKCSVGNGLDRSATLPHRPYYCLVQAVSKNVKIVFEYALHLLYKTTLQRQVLVKQHAADTVAVPEHNPRKACGSGRRHCGRHPWSRFCWLHRSDPDPRGILRGRCNTGGCCPPAWCCSAAGGTHCAWHRWPGG